ncbi:MAG: hypothetical protein RL272_315 [Candidatus Parcubacteria bacterium]|jgi:hypothetical protein
MDKDDIKKGIGAAKAYGAAGGIIAAAVFSMVARGRARKKARLVREAAEAAEAAATKQK